MYYHSAQQVNNMFIGGHSTAWCVNPKDGALVAGCCELTSSIAKDTGMPKSPGLLPYVYIYNMYMCIYIYCTVYIYIVYIMYYTFCYIMYNMLYGMQYILCITYCILYTI